MASDRALPPPRIRENARARRVSLRVSATAGLEIVVPRGFSRARIPAIVDRHRAWIEAQFARLAALDRRLPDALELPALGECWPIVRSAGPRPRLRTGNGGGELLIEGADDGQARALLRGFLLGRARTALGPWLAATAAETGLRYTRLTVRAQRGRWGSCSARGAISLNAKLLFLAPELVHHVLIHELCHTVHLNHSPAFWALVARCDPDWQARRRHLRALAAAIPAWLEA